MSGSDNPFDFLLPKPKEEQQTPYGHAASTPDSKLKEWKIAGMLWLGCIAVLLALGLMADLILPPNAYLAELLGDWGYSKTGAFFLSLSQGPFLIVTGIILEMRKKPGVRRRLFVIGVAFFALHSLAVIYISLEMKPVEETKEMSSHGFFGGPTSPSPIVASACNGSEYCVAPLGLCSFFL